MNDNEKAIEILENIDIEANNGYSKEDVEYTYLMAILALKQQLNNGWISCSRRLPTDEESKLYRGEFIIQTKDCELPYVALWNRIKGIWQDDYEELDDVIAWQPLPEPYKED